MQMRRLWFRSGHPQPVPPSAGEGEARVRSGLHGFGRRLLIGLGAVVGLLVIVAVVLQVAGLLMMFRMPSSAMAQTLPCGSHFIAEDISYHWRDPARNDVVVFHMPEPHGSLGVQQGGAEIVKRVVGLPGDRIEVRDGHVLVNGRALDSGPAGGSFGPHTVAADSYFMLGDVPEISDDSRYFGDVPRSAIVGRVIFVWWPLSHLGVVGGSAPAHARPSTC